jgi:hypothetical protein
MAKSAADRSKSDFEKSLDHFSEKLKRRADGQVCGGCRFYIRGLCVEKNINIHYEDAVACSFYEEEE